MGNYLGAVSAYAHALTLNSHLYELYAGRAQAQLALGNFNRAIIDASKVSCFEAHFNVLINIYNKIWLFKQKIVC